MRTVFEVRTNEDETGLNDMLGFYLKDRNNVYIKLMFERRDDRRRFMEMTAEEARMDAARAKAAAAKRVAKESQMAAVEDRMRRAAEEKKRAEEEKRAEVKAFEEDRKGRVAAYRTSKEEKLGEEAAEDYYEQAEQQDVVSEIWCVILWRHSSNGEPSISNVVGPLAYEPAFALLQKMARSVDSGSHVELKRLETIDVWKDMLDT